MQGIVGRRAWIIGVCVAGWLASPALATFHLMQVEQVIAGVNGDTNAQAIQLRMRSSVQNFIGGVSRLVVRNASGASPVTLISFPSDVANGAFGDRVLVTTAAFNSLTSPTTVPDFTMTNRIPDAYLPAGSLTFESTSGIVYWRLSWGGASYTGLNTGAIDNDRGTVNGNFGPPWPAALLTSGVDALLFQGTASAFSTQNEDDYAVTNGGSTWTNNPRNSFTLSGGAVCTDGDADGYGDPGDASCPAGPETDCDDTQAAINPGAAENCTDTVDNNCDTLTDCDDPTCVEDPACLTSEIPAASTWGLVTMVAALLTCGTCVIRRRATRAE